MTREPRMLPTTPGPEDARMAESPAQVDFFISYTTSDRAWAEWIALGLPRFDGQGWWLGQATCLMLSWSVAVSNSVGVR